VWKELLDDVQHVDDGCKTRKSAPPGHEKGKKKSGVLRDPMSKAYVKKFFISVTEEEFSQGLLWRSEQE